MQIVSHRALPRGAKLKRKERKEKKEKKEKKEIDWGWLGVGELRIARAIGIRLLRNRFLK
jgi:hypothetical protein